MAYWCFAVPRICVEAIACAESIIYTTILLCIIILCSTRWWPIEFGWRPNGTTRYIPKRQITLRKENISLNVLYIYVSCILVVDKDRRCAYDKNGNSNGFPHICTPFFSGPLSVFSHKHQRSDDKRWGNGTSCSSFSPVYFEQVFRFMFSEESLIVCVRNRERGRDHFPQFFNTFPVTVSVHDAQFTICWSRDNFERKSGTCAYLRETLWSMASCGVLYEWNMLRMSPNPKIEPQGCWIRFFFACPANPFHESDR